MENNVKACVLTAHNSRPWYPKGQQRLIESLRFHGFTHDIVAFALTESKGAWTGTVRVNGGHRTGVHSGRYASDCPYTLKAVAWEYASEMLGYDTILWLDCSVWAIKPIEPIFDIIARDGSYFWSSGFSVGHTCGDHALEHFGLTRAQAFDIPDSSTSMMGLKLSNPTSRKFLDEWLEAARLRLFHGPRDQITDHQDITKRVQMFEHRQDQSIASILIHLHKLNMFSPEVYSMYANELGNYPDTVRLVMRGL